MSGKNNQFKIWEGLEIKIEVSFRFKISKLFLKTPLIII